MISTVAVLFASFLSALFFFAPILWLHLGRADEANARQSLFRWFTFLCFCLYVFSFRALSYSAMTIHADAPALGLSATACALLYFKRQPATKHLFLSAVLAVLAVWTKQVAFPLLIALPLYLWITAGFKCAVRYVAYLLITGLSFSALFVALFGYEHLVFNMFTIPGEYPWRVDDKIDKIDRFSRSSRTLIEQCFLPSMLIVSGLFYRFFNGANKAERAADWFRNNPWTMLVLVGLLMMPFSAMGASKKGGDVNSFTFSVYFILAAATLSVTEFYGKTRRELKLRPSRVRSTW